LPPACASYVYGCGVTCKRRATKKLSTTAAQYLQYDVLTLVKLLADNGVNAAAATSSRTIEIDSLHTSVNITISSNRIANHSVAARRCLENCTPGSVSHVLLCLV